MSSDKLGSSRTVKSFKNAFFNLFNQAISVILQFALRTVFIRTLSVEYLGVNGLFSNILTMLSLTELGLGTAIVCSMYEPLAKKDENAIIKYFNAYRKIYATIGVIVGMIGLCIVPFINYFVADANNIPHLKILFVLYLADTVASYFFAQYRSLFSADQKDYINANNRTMFLIIQSILQMVILFVIHSYIMYMVVKIVCNLAAGFSLSLKAKQEFYFIVNKKDTKLNNDERKILINDSIGVFSTRVELTVLNSTDNIILSSFLGSIITGIYSNYSLIMGTVSAATGLIFAAIQASIGNYFVRENKDSIKKMYENINYIYYCLYGICAICLFSLISPFIQVWLGSNYLLAVLVVAIISLNFYLSNARQATLQFITVGHLLKKINIKNIVEAVLNIIISIILVKKVGLVGIFIGTTMSLLLTSVWYEPYVLYKCFLGKGLLDYYLKLVIRIGTVLVGAVVSFIINRFIFANNVLSLIICFIVTAIIAVVSVTLPYVLTKEFKYTINAVKQFIGVKLGGKR